MDKNKTHIKLISHTAALCKDSGISRRDFVGECYKYGMREITAKRLYDGDTNFRTSTVAVAAKILGVGIGQVVEIAEENEHCA